MSLKCLLIDDEPIALNVLEDYIKQLPEMEVTGRCTNAMDGFSILQKQQTDILFIDIQMPGINGIDFLHSMQQLPAVIITSAYPEYAVNGFELDVTDYLLKPISFDRFLKAISKVYKRHAAANEYNREKINNNAYLMVKSNNEKVRLNISQILFIKGMENYVRIYCEDKTVIASSTMRNMEETLAQYNFSRIHRSYIVGLDKIDSVSNNSVKIDTMEIPVGISYKKNFHALLEKFHKDKV